jgi:DNA polymerase III subunit alpha
MSISYVGLHRHSSASFLDGYGLPDQIVSRLQDLGQTACAITDHGSTWGHLGFYQAMEKARLRSILGVEYYHVPDRARHAEGRGSGRRVKNPEGDYDIAHLTVLARNQVGYRNLLALTKLSYQAGFYRKPTIDWQDIFRHQEGLVVLTGCVGGQLSSCLYPTEGEHGFELDRGRDLVRDWLEYLRGQIEHLYVEITPCPGLQISVQACRELWAAAKELSLPLVLTDDAHFPCPEDHAAEDAMVAIQTRRKVNDPERKLKIPAYHYHCTGEEIVERARQVLPGIAEGDLIRAAEQSVAIAGGCEVEIPRPKGPLFTVPGELTSDGLLQKWIDEGKAYRRHLGLLPPLGSDAWGTYEERERYEIDIIRHHGFTDYFLLVTDIARWAKSHGYWCIARGSCGGSLVCWYLDITQIDPIQLKLPVERFIDKTRKDLPDIDLDVDSRHRDKIFRYLEEKYGKEHCAQIAALSTFRSKQAINDICKVYDIPSQVGRQLIQLMPEVDAEEGIKARGRLEHLFQSNEDVQQLLKQYPGLKVAAQIESQCRQATIHAAGFVVDQIPLSEIVGIITQKDGTRLMACDMQQAAKQGFLKIDCLSVEMLATVSETLAQIGKNHDWLYQLPRDDKATYEMLSAGRNYGVFQMKGSTAGKLLVQMQPTQFSDLVALGALARPGPLQSGGAQEYIERKHGRKAMPRYHPLIMDIVSETYGVILYQEQVMRIMREVGGMDWLDVHAIRKLVSKSGGAVAMEKYKPAYLQSAREKGVPENEAEHLWLQCQRAGNYIFNQAHSAAYALIGYWSAYLKCHYPAVFCCACANHEKKEQYQREILREFKQMGGTLELLDYNRSKSVFTTPTPDVILGGFQTIKGMGQGTAEKLVAGQPYRNWTQFLLKCPSSTAKDLQATGVHTGQIDLDMALVVAPWYAEVEYLPVEQEAFERMHCHRVSDVLQAMESGRQMPVIRLLGRVTNADQSVGKHSSHSDSQERCVLTVADPTGSIDVWFSPWKWAEVKRAWNPLQGETEGIGNSVYVVASVSHDRTRIFGEKAVLLRQSKAQIDPRTRKLIREEKKKKVEQSAMEFAE